ncbi:hypothetical protein PHAVU_006G093400 [Phaseolus vulgaris]|uniref:Uncharacterized protein n=1 Tax=Phaseolus vulgaris TaxID=3885 RepID=V7BR57_PHAVU|nr:hypothetical protein PHAVU_006G093400g [Phaseolus vulgaris]ESW19061.1 hypothetical protein PHAVU_006G093400g [Phaseolus vulgaris]
MIDYIMNLEIPALTQRLLTRGSIASPKPPICEWLKWMLRLNQSLFYDKEINPVNPTSLDIFSFFSVMHNLKKPFHHSSPVHTERSRSP